MTMKKVFNSLFVIIVAMITFAGCAKQEIDAPATPEAKTVQFFANSIETKTEFGTPENGVYPTLWSAGDKVKILVNLEQIKNTEKTVEVECSDDFKSARFESELAQPEADDFTFYSISPASALSGKSSQKLYVTIPTEQAPLPTSVDKKAQLLYAASETTEAMPSSVELTYHHLTAYGRLSLTNLTSDVTSVSGVTLEAPADVYLAGGWDYFVADGSFVVRSEKGSNTITISTENTTDIWFACAPVDMSGKTLTLTVTTDKGDLVKEIAFPANRKFEAGRIAKFTVNMEGIGFAGTDEPEQPEETEEAWTLVTDVAELSAGDKVVIAAATENYALATTQNNNNRASVAITKSDNVITINDDVQVITIEEGTDNNSFAFNVGSGYLYAASTSSNHLKTKNSLDANGSWSIEISEIGVATIKSIGNTSKGWLRFNTSNSPKIFSCYGSGQTDVAIYRLTGTSGDEGETPAPEAKTLVSIAVSGYTETYTVGDTFEFDGTVTATYDDESTATVTPTSVSTPDMTTEGTKEITISYTEADVTVSAKYEIEVVEVQDLPKGIASIKSKATSNEETDFTVTLTDAVVTYVSGSSAYIEDAEAGILVYKSGHGLAVGDKLNGEVSGKVKLYSSLREITDIDYSNAKKTTDAEIPVTVLTLAELNADGAYDKYENMRIKIVDAKVSANKQISQNGQTYALYFKNNSVTGFDIDNIIDVTGYPSKYNADIQFNIWENAVVKKASKTTITGVSDLTVGVGASKVINASASSGEKVTYLSADPTIATVDETGTVTGVAEGETTITVSVPANDVYPAAEQTCNVTVTAGEVAKAWTLVTDASTLKAGDQIVIVATKSNYAMSSTQNSNNRAQAEVIKSGNTISEPGTSVQKLILEAGKTAGTFAFNTGSGYLYAASSSKNYLRTEKTLSANSSWNITITTAGVATIKATGSNTRNWMRYNSSNNPPIFSCYSSGQADISIYRYE